MSIEIIAGVIEAGQSLSPVMDCRAGEIVRLTMPPDWTNAVLTFQMSSDGLFFNSVYDHEGHELKVVVIAGAAVIVPVDYLAAAAYLKFRSGTADTPVNQPAKRDFAIALRVPDAETPPAGDDAPTINIRLRR